MVHQGSCKETLLHLHLLRESSSVSYPLQSKIADVLMDTKLKDYSDEHIKANHDMEYNGKKDPSPYKDIIHTTFLADCLKEYAATFMGNSKLKRCE
ncbi:8907_t:CDS:2 [Entrophospora sp. SA101]|nr:8907_t:CDS:2 [Entrophospora sp. SA101]